MPEPYNDGNILSDSFEVTLQSQTYIVNNATQTSPSLEITRNDTKGAVAAQRFVSNVGTGTIELQINTSAQNQSLKFEELTIPATAAISGVAKVVILTEETQNIAAGSVRTRTFNFREKLSA